MNPGNLKDKVVFQRQSATVDAFGQKSGAWTTTLTLWTSIRPLYGKEKSVNGVNITAETIEITARKKSTASVIKSDRLSYDGRYWNITRINNIDKDWSKIDCEVMQ
jgi:SPP1 family predicted phage head-tail adaptor